MTYLTQSYEELQTQVIAALETAASLTFSPKSERITQFYARCLGQSTLWRTKDEGELLALLNLAEGGSSVSDKTYSYAQLLDTLNGTLADSGGGGGEEDDDMTLISRTAISSPQSYVDVAIPASGYEDVFRLICSRITFDDGSGGVVGDIFVYTASLDGGLTFKNATDDYLMNSGSGSFSDNVGYLGGNAQEADFAKPALFDCLVDPGDSNTPQSILTSAGYYPPTFNFATAPTFSQLKTSLVGRATTIRLQPDAGGARKIHSGLILLYGTASS